jgi:hypothetical protein
LSWTYNLYSSSNKFGFTNSYHIQCNLPPHKFRTIMMEFRRNKEVADDLESFVTYMKESFGDTFRLFEYDDNVQFDADQENSAILVNLLNQTD